MFSRAVLITLVSFLTWFARPRPFGRAMQNRVVHTRSVRVAHSLLITIFLFQGDRHGTNEIDEVIQRRGHTRSHPEHGR